MARALVERFIDNTIVRLLDRLVDQDTSTGEYRGAMYGLGNAFGNILIHELKDIRSVGLASTAEDADYLGKGIIDTLEQQGKEVLLTVFWNKRFVPNVENNIPVAPIVKEFHEERNLKPEVLIVIKSIISSSCVVRTNLTRLIEETDPEKIFIVAPVLLADSIRNLEAGFTAQITEKFHYLYFAEDDEKTDEGFVIPGIGGDVYKRLGFNNQDSKNRYVPEIVKQRRYKRL